MTLEKTSGAEPYSQERGLAPLLQLPGSGGWRCAVCKIEYWPWVHVCHKCAPRAEW